MQLCLSCRSEFSGDGWVCPSCGFAPEQRSGFRCFAPALADQGGSIDVASFEGLATAEDSSFWFPPRNRLITWALGQYFPAAASFLELGCGTGYVLSGVGRAFPHLTLTGADIYVQGLERARRRLPAAELIQVDGLDLPYRRQFDVAGAFDVVEHIDDDVGALTQMKLAVKPGGGIMVIVPRHRFLWSRIDDLAAHRRRYSRAMLETAARAAGLEIVRILSFAAWTLPLQMASRILGKPKGATLAEALELHMPAPLQRALEAVLDAERATIRAGVDYPFGASLMLIAKRGEEK